MKPKATKKIPQMQDVSSEDDDEMERNFALLSKNKEQWNTEEKESLEAEEEEELEEGDEEEDDEDVEDDQEDDDEDAEDEEEDVEEASAAVSGDGESRDAEEGEEEEDDDDDDDEDESSSGEEPEEKPTPGTRRQGQLETEDDVKKELSNMSFEEIMQLQNRVGTKAYNKIAYNSDAGKKKKKNPDQMKRLNKHKPQEISSKQRVPFLRKVVPVKKAISRDPRFDDLSGEYRPEVFSQTFKFITDIQDREKIMVKKKLKTVKSNEKKEELKFLLKRMENQERERKRKEQQREKELLFKKKQRDLVGEGHRPFFLKKSDKKKLELAEKFKDLKRSGKLENFMSKKRKRNATKDRRRLPKQHNKS